MKHLKILLKGTAVLVTVILLTLIGVEAIIGPAIMVDKTHNNLWFLGYVPLFLGFSYLLGLDTASRKRTRRPTTKAPIGSSKGQE